MIEGQITVAREEIIDGTEGTHTAGEQGDEHNSVRYAISFLFSATYIYGSPSLAILC